MTNQDAWNIYKKYLSAWNSNSAAQRAKIAKQLLADSIQYQTVRHPLSTGPKLVIEDMVTFNDKFPGGHFEIGDVSTQHDVALVTWVIIQANGVEFARGHDQFTVDPSGKITKIVTFGPSVTKPN